MTVLEPFLVDGFVRIRPERLSESEHDQLYKAAGSVYAEADASERDTVHLDVLGDRALLQRIPEVRSVLEDPAITAALTELLGRDYFLHPHCFLHRAGEFDQVFHQDGNLPWNERGHFRPHRSDWALLFYYPQTVTLENGPTEVVAGSQYWTKDFEREDGTWHAGDAFDRKFFSEVMPSTDTDFRDRRNDAALDSLGVPALERQYLTMSKGEAVICNYDIAHRGSRQRSDQTPRYLYKFYFARTTEPVSASTNKAFGQLRPELRPVVEYCRRWQRGHSLPTVEKNNAWSLNSHREDQRIAAAYCHAAHTEHAVLLAGLTNEREAVRRAAAYGLRAAHQDCTESVLALTQNENQSTRRYAYFALGNAGNAAKNNIIDTILKCFADEPDDLARSNAAYALGQISRGALADPNRVMRAILARLEPGVEPDNTKMHSLSRSTVRQSLAYAALQLARNHELDKGLAATLETLRSDRDRYVAGFFDGVARSP